MFSHANENLKAKNTAVLSFKRVLRDWNTQYSAMNAEDRHSLRPSQLSCNII